MTVASPSPKGKLGTTASLSSLPACLMGKNKMLLTSRK